jgi:hypothetical protein
LTDSDASQTEELRIVDSVESISTAEMEENIMTDDTVTSIDIAYEEGRLAIAEGKAVLNEIAVPEVVMDDATAQKKRSAWDMEEEEKYE